MADSPQTARAGKATAPGDDLDSLKVDMAALRAELDSVLKAIKGLGVNAVATAKRQQGAALDRITEEAQSLTDEAVAVGRDQLAEVERRIRDQPLAAVGIAFAIGLLFGSLRR